MSRHVTLLVAVAAAALAASPALAAHKFSCYDYAWQSQDMKGCLADPQQWEKSHHHMAMHKPMHRAMHKPMKAAKAHDMKDMKNMHDMKKPDATGPAPDHK